MSNQATSHPSVLRTKKFSGPFSFKSGTGPGKPDGWSLQQAACEELGSPHSPISHCLPSLHTYTSCYVVLLLLLKPARPCPFSGPVFRLSGALLTWLGYLCMVDSLLSFLDTFTGHHLWHVFLFYFLTVTYLYLAYSFLF